MSVDASDINAYYLPRRWYGLTGFFLAHILYCIGYMVAMALLHLFGTYACMCTRIWLSVEYWFDEYTSPCWRDSIEETWLPCASSRQE